MSALEISVGPDYLAHLVWEPLLAPLPGCGRAALERSSAASVSRQGLARSTSDGVDPQVKVHPPSLPSQRPWGGRIGGLLCSVDRDLLT